jgi:uncharacterized repeat protein (TIGR01451 family)
MPDKPDKPPASSDKPESRLDRLQKQLYSREEGSEVVRRTKELPHMGVRRALPPTQPGPVDTTRLKDMTARVAQRRRRLLIGIGSGVGVLLLIGGAIGVMAWYRTRQQVTEQQIALTLKGPSEVAAGDVVTYEVSVHNDSHVTWEKVEIVFEPPPGFRFQESDQDFTTATKQYIWAPGDIPEQQTKTARLTGQLLGEQDAAALAQIEVLLTPQNFPSGRFSKKALLSTTISAMPLELAIDAPKDVSTGDRLVATIQVRNLGQTALQKAYLEIGSPEEIIILATDADMSPGFDEADRRWRDITVEPLQTATRKLIFQIRGKPGEKRQLAVAAGIEDGNDSFVQREVSHVVTVATASVAIEQFFNDKAGTLAIGTGDQVNAKLKYQNISTIGLQDVKITVKLEGDYFDPASLKLFSGGGYNPTTRTITWSSASVPELRVLQPQQSGEITFSFNMLKAAQFPKTGEQLRNFALISTATIDSTGVGATSNPERKTNLDRTVMSVETDGLLTADAFYDDGRLGIKSEGPIPPKAGQKTTYTVRLRAGSSLNDLGEATVTAILPDGVQYTDQIYKTTGEVRFNDRTGEVVWTMPLIEAGVGRIKPAHELYFQVAITPGEHQRNNTVAFLKSLMIEGTDEFTDTAVTTKLESVQLPTTETAVPGKGRVQ